MLCPPPAGHRRAKQGGQLPALTPCRRGCSRGRRGCARTPRCPCTSSPAGRMAQGSLQAGAGSPFIPREASSPRPGAHRGQPAPVGIHSPLPAAPERARPSRHVPKCDKSQQAGTCPACRHQAAVKGAHGRAAGQEMPRGEGKLGRKAPRDEDGLMLLPPHRFNRPCPCPPRRQRQLRPRTSKGFTRMYWGQSGSVMHMGVRVRE